MYPVDSGLGRSRRLGLSIQAPVVGKVGISLKTPSEKRAASVIGPVIASANGGNLNAVAILDSRRSIGISVERAVWQKGFDQVLSAVRASYDPQRSALLASIPGSAQVGPEAAAAWALGTVYSAPKTTTIQKVANVVVPALLDTEAGQQIQSAVVSAAVQDQVQTAAKTAKGWIIPALIVGGFFFLKGRK